MTSFLLAAGPCTADTPAMELTQWAGWSWRRAVRDPDSLSLAGVPGLHPSAAMLTETENDLWLYGDGDLLYRGRIIAGSDTLNGDGGAEVNVESVDYKGLLKRRVLLRALTFTQIDQAEIAWALVNEAQTYSISPHPAHTLGITRGTIPAGRPRDRTYEAGATIGELIDALSEVIDGFEWAVDPLLRLQIGSPILGQTRAITLDYGGLVNSLTRTRDTTGVANGVWQSGDQETTTPVYVESAVVPARQLWQGSFADPDLTLQSTVDDRAAGMLAERSIPRATFTGRLSPERWTPDAVALGDTLDLSVVYGRLNYVALPVRVVELVVAGSADGSVDVTGTLVEAA